MPRKACRLLGAILLSAPLMPAQGVKPAVRHPGDFIRYEIKFNGSDGNKIKSVGLVLHARSTMSEDQSGFSYVFDGEEAQSSGLGIFRQELKIPDDAATGEYYLAVKATVVTGAGKVTYIDGMDFNVAPIHIENQRRFLPPHITVTEQQ